MPSPPSRPLRPLAACLAAAALAAPGLARAGTVELVAEQPLDFGAMVVFGTGTKQIAPDGAATVSGLVTVPGAREGPARFTLRYRPDARGRSALVMVTIAAGGTQSVSSTVGTLTRLTPDIGGTVINGPVDNRVVRLPLCNAPVCDTSFRVGGTLNLTGGATTARFSFPLQVTVRLLSELPG